MLDHFSLFVTIGGGQNRVDNASTYGVIDGGAANTISNASHFSTISGGLLNRVLNSAKSVIGGGINNSIENAAFAFVVGRQARANHNGVFSWADNREADINSSDDNQFLVRANGGIWFGAASTNITPTIGAGVFISTSTGAHLTTGGAWTNSSDRNAKTAF